MMTMVSLLQSSLRDLVGFASLSFWNSAIVVHSQQSLRPSQLFAAVAYRQTFQPFVLCQKYGIKYVNRWRYKNVTN